MDNLFCISQLGLNAPTFIYIVLLCTVLPRIIPEYCCFMAGLLIYSFIFVVMYFCSGLRLQ